MYIFLSARHKFFEKYAHSHFTFRTENYHEKTLKELCVEWLASAKLRVKKSGNYKTSVIITSPKSKTSVREIPIPAFVLDILKRNKRSDNCYVLSGNCHPVIIGINSINTAFALRERGYDEMIIFLTSHTEFMLDAFKVKAFRFLDNPLDSSKFNEAFSEAKKEIMNTEHILLSDKSVKTVYVFA